MSESEFQQPDDTEAEPEPTTEPEPEPEETEPEQPEAEPEPEPEPVQPEAQGTTPEEWDKRFKQADAAWKRYASKVSDLWEEDAIALVPFTMSPSAPPGFISGHDAGHLDDDSKAGLLEWLGFAREQDYEPDPQTQECRTCKGKGKTATGSHVGGFETHPCPICNGTGAEGLDPVTLASAGNGQSEEPFTLAPVGNEQATERDSWKEARILPDGRPNPNFGKMPQYKVPVEPYGQTAGLGAQDVTADA